MDFDYDALWEEFNKQARPEGSEFASDALWDDASSIMESAMSLIFNGIGSRVKEEIEQLRKDNERLMKETNALEAQLQKTKNESDIKLRGLNIELGFLKSRLGNKGTITVFNRCYEVYDPECPMCHGKKSVTVTYPDGSTGEVKCPCVDKPHRFLYWAEPRTLEVYTMEDGTLWYPYEEDKLKKVIYPNHLGFFKTPMEVKNSISAKDNELWSEERTKFNCRDYLSTHNMDGSPRC